MGRNVTKIEYPCDCSKYTGDKCINSFIMSYNRSVDVGTLYHVYHGQAYRMGSFSDAGLAALVDILSGEGNAELTEEEKNHINNF